MFVEKLVLENYRRFSRLEISPARRLNVIVGINGAGKTTILNAAAKMLSWYVRRLGSPNGAGSGTSIFDSEISSGAAHSAITLSAATGTGSVEWKLLKNAKGSPLSSSKSDFTGLNEYVKSLRSDDSGRKSIPVIVSYGVNRSVLDIPLRIRRRHQFSVFNAYDDAFDRAADFRLFFEWFRANEDIENERLAECLTSGNAPQFGGSAELAAVRRALKTFLPEFDGWRIRRSPLRMEVRKDGKAFNVEQLSDGEKCTIALVGDLARRLVVANPEMSNPLHGEGIVLVDEIELHLHPAWQKTILPRFMETFPNLQFIVTTHSPLVLAQLNALLYGDENHGIAVFALKGGDVASMIDPETGLIGSGEMDEVIASIDEEFDALTERIGR